MKKIVKGLISTTVVGILSLGTAITANAAELRLWEHEQFTGHTISFSYCDADFADNIYDSGRQNIVSYVTIWNNSVIAGDKAIAKIYNNGVGNPSFGALNQADHATCYG